MALPIVAVVGRPNVGKSTFFNKMCGERISIVEDIPGVTRDRVYADVEWMGRRFSMVDTGGLDMRSEDVLLSQMRHQAQIAMDTADVICFFCDGRTGLTNEDEEVANYLRRTHKPLLLVVNKIDVLDYFDFDCDKAVEYARMRNPDIEVLFVSAKTGEGVEQVAEWILNNTRAWNGQ